MSIADTGRFWEILVIAVLQILEDSVKYWLYQYCRYWKINTNIRQSMLKLPTPSGFHDLFFKHSLQYNIVQSL
jgi:hypothetical protein